MSYSHQSTLYGSRESAIVTERQRLAQAVLLPFEVLQRQRWSAPWNVAQR